MSNRNRRSNQHSPSSDRSRNANDIGSYHSQYPPQPHHAYQPYNNTSYSHQNPAYAYDSHQNPAYAYDSHQNPAYPYGYDSHQNPAHAYEWYANQSSSSPVTNASARYTNQSRHSPPPPRRAQVDERKRVEYRREDVKRDKRSEPSSNKTDAYEGPPDKIQKKSCQESVKESLKTLPRTYMISGSAGLVHSELNKLLESKGFREVGKKQKKRRE